MKRELAGKQEDGYRQFSQTLSHCHYPVGLSCQQGQQQLLESDLSRIMKCNSRTTYHQS